MGEKKDKNVVSHHGIARANFARIELSRGLGLILCI